MKSTGTGPSYPNIWGPQESKYFHQFGLFTGSDAYLHKRSMNGRQGSSHMGERKKRESTHVLKVFKNIYGTKQAGRILNKLIHSGLLERGYVQSSSLLCVYYIHDTVFLLNVDDGIFVGPNLGSIKSLIACLQSDPRYKTSYNITDERALNNYLGVQIRCQRSGEFLLTQPHLIQQILNDLRFKENTKPSNLPALTTKELHKDPDGPTFEEAWPYGSIIGKLNCLEKSTRVDQIQGHAMLLSTQGAH